MNSKQTIFSDDSAIKFLARNLARILVQKRQSISDYEVGGNLQRPPLEWRGFHLKRTADNLRACEKEAKYASSYCLI